MNTTVYELKQYYVAAGGEAETVENITTIPDMIAAITALGAGRSGGGGGVLDVTCSIEQVAQGATTYTLDKTWKEIHDAFTAGTMVTVLRDNGIYWAKDIVLYVGRDTVDEQTNYTVGFGSGYDVLSLMINTENGYPTYTMT